VAGFQPRQTQAFLANTRTWIDTHTDQVIVIVSAVLGLAGSRHHRQVAGDEDVRACARSSSSSFEMELA
jgi:hypothetical protein